MKVFQSLVTVQVATASSLLRNWKNETCTDLDVAEQCEFGCGGDLGDCIIACGSNDQGKI